MDQPEYTKNPEENPEAANPLDPQEQGDDPINAAGDYIFKRFGSDTQPAEPERTVDPEMEEVAAVLSHAEEPENQPARAALTITIQSWATPAVGLAMLVLGLLGGYFLRPLISPSGGPSGVATPQTSTETQTQSSPEDREALMAALVPSIRHFLGDPDAPITLIEFSDFQ